MHKQFVCFMVRLIKEQLRSHMTGQRQGTNQPIAASFPLAVWRNPLCLPPPRGGTCPTSVSSLEALAFVGLQAELRLGVSVVCGCFCRDSCLWILLT